MDSRNDAPLVTAVVLTWNSRKFVTKCLEALGAEAKRLPVELYVVDNGSTDGTQEVVAAKASTLGFLSSSLIRLSDNQGTTRARNLAMRRASGRFVLLLDADTEIQPGALKALAETIQTQERIGVVSPQLLASDGTTQAACKRFPTVRTKMLKVIPSRLAHRIAEEDELYPRSLYEGNAVSDVDYSISAAWLINRTAMLDVGLLDESIFYAPEDVDYCLRMWLSGWRVVYNPLAQVLHHTQRLSYRSLRVMGMHAQGLLYYFRKHRYFWSRDTLYRRLPG